MNIWALFGQWWLGSSSLLVSYKVIQGKADTGPEIKMGTVKQAAVKALLLGVSQQAYDAMVTHMSLMSNETWQSLQCVLVWTCFQQCYQKDLLLYSTLRHGCGVCPCCNANEEARSALSDAILAWKFLYPGSAPPEGSFPTQAEEIARRAAAAAAAKMIPDKLTSPGPICILSHCLKYEWIMFS